MFYEKLIEKTGVEGKVILPETEASRLKTATTSEAKEIDATSVEKMFQVFKYVQSMSENRTFGFRTFGPVQTTLTCSNKKKLLS